MRPMLAAKIGDPEALRYPLLATPKIDGIRCLTIEAGIVAQNVDPKCSPVSRRLKPIPNVFIHNSIMTTCPHGLDGELITGYRDVAGIFHPHPFNDVSSEVMSEEGWPTFQYIVFDCNHNHILATGQQQAYWRRMRALEEMELPEFCVKLMPIMVKSVEEMAAYEAACLLKGYEGIMLREPEGPYKFGRSTLREQYLLKVKRFQDAEAVVIGMEELMHNDNPQEQNALGHSERSTHQANMRPSGMMGKLLVRDLVTDCEFSIGTGFSELQRIAYFKEEVISRILKYRFQPHGVLSKPRFPVFLGWRSPDDL